MKCRATSRGLLAGLILLCLGSLGAARTWTDDSGQHHVDGEFVSVSAGLVTLKTDDGKTIQIALEKLSKADQDFIGKVNKPGPAPAPNPFVEVPKGAVAPVPVDAVARTQDYLTDFLKRLEKRNDEIAALDTQEKRNAAHEAMLKGLASELRAKTLTFKFTIEDVAENNPTTTRLKIDEPIGTDGFDTVIKSVVLSIRKSEAAKINMGDTLVLSGNGALTLGGVRERKSGMVVGGAAEICSIESAVSQRAYHIYLSGLKFHIEPKKQAGPAPPGK